MKNKFKAGAFPVCAFLLSFSFLPATAAPSKLEPAPLPRPLTLEVALGYAVQYNPTLLRTREQIREQEGVLVEARAGQLPTLSASGSLSRTDAGLLLENALADRDNWTVSVGASQVLYAGGGTVARIRGQKEQVEAARLTFTAAVNDTLLTVRQQFDSVLLDRELIVVQEEALRVLENELTNARNRRAAGTGSDFDVLRAEVAVANARPALIRARNAYRLAQDQLRASLGAPSTDPRQPTELEVVGELAMARKDLFLADAIAAARAHRPELLQLERQAKAAEQNVLVARSGYLPTLKATAGYEWTKPSLVSTPDSRLDGWTIGLRTDWNIFDGRATAGKVAQSKSRLTQARIAIDERALAVEVEVRSAFSSLTEATELLAASEKVVEQARESLRLSQARYQAGTATQLDVLSAQSALTEARSNLAQAQYGYAVAFATLNRAMGLGAQ